MEQVLAQLVGLYRAQGEDAVREALEGNPPEVIEAVIRDLRGDETD